MRPRDPRPLHEIPDAELSPKVLTHQGWHLFWTSACIAVHLGSLFYIYGIEPEPFSPGYNRAVAAVIVGPLIFHMYMHLHLIWWPYYREMKRRGGLPPEEQRKPPYCDLKKLILMMPLGYALMGHVPAIVLIWFEYSSGTKVYPAGVTFTFVGVPIWIGAWHYIYFWYEEKKHVQC